MVAQRRALERMYTDRCNVIVREKSVNPVNKRTEFTEVTALMDVPCRVSFAALSGADGSPAAAVGQDVKLFTAPEIAIPPGSKIIITRGGIKELNAYAYSSEPAIYPSHQEIRLELWKDWA